MAKRRVGLERVHLNSRRRRGGHNDLGIEARVRAEHGLLNSDVVKSLKKERGLALAAQIEGAVDREVKTRNSVGQGGHLNKHQQVAQQAR